MRQIIATALAAILLLSFSACNGHGTSAPPVVVPDSGYEIRLQARTFTPPRGIAADLPARVRAVIDARQPADPRAHVYVQLVAPPNAAQRERLAAQGVELLDPINRRTWTAAVTAAGTDALARTAGVRWADLIPPGDKLSKALDTAGAPRPHQLRPGGRVAYLILFHKDVTAEEVRGFAQRTGATLEGFDAKAFRTVRGVTVVVPAGGLATLAQADIVAWIEPVPPPDIDDNLLQSQPLANVDDVQAAPYNLNGSGINVGVWEANDTILATHVDLTPRVIVEAGQSPTNDDHAAHVAGTIGASGVNIPNAEGMAPQATIASYDADDDAVEMTAAATSPGGMGDPTPIRISNHSYGIGIGWNNAGNAFTNNQASFGLYTIASVGFDNIALNDGLIIHKSSGNDRDDDPPMPVPGQPADCEQGGFGVDADCIEARGVAKNVITVGAMNGAAAISDFSSFGPTDDGRIKPDLMAHGNLVFSLGSANNNDTSIFSGTSQATPVVSGISALVLQEAANRGIPITDPAAMKALLIQTARDVAGVGQATVGPDYATGWGIADALNAVNLLRQGGLATGTIAAEGPGGAWTRTIFVPAGLPELHVTLAWTDPPGTPMGQILINDLDLRLIAPDLTTFTPWTLNPALPGNAAVRNGGDDTVNNVEQVSVLTPVAGEWTVQVTADPGLLPQGPQAFAVAGILPRSDLVMVMDRSGSMLAASGSPGIDKITALRTSANEFIDLLDLSGGHTLGLVQFQETVVPFVPPFDLQLLDGANVDDAHTAVGDIDAGGLTNIIGGIEAAITQLSGAVTPAPRQVIFVFSDGKHNRPLGTDLADVGPSITAGNFRFFSVGFGTDVDDATLSSLAAANEGIHVNEQDLSPIQLTKYFLTVAALAHDLTVLADPSFDVGAGQAAELPIELSNADRTVYIAVNWTNARTEPRLTLEGPDPRCKAIDIDAAPQGLQVKRGATYRLIRLDLPYVCGGGRTMHAGRWVVRAVPQRADTIDIMVLGDSNIALDSFVELDDKRSLYTIGARLTGIPNAGFGEVIAHHVRPLPPSNDSTKADLDPKQERPPSSYGKRRESTLRATGSKGKEKESRVATATLDATTLEPGLHQVRFVASVRQGGQTLRRESTVSFYVKK